MDRQIIIKSSQEIELMRKSGDVATGALRRVLAEVREGITTLELDKIAEDYILSQGAKPSFKTVEDYKYTTCINVNEGLVHGLPTNYALKKGDLVSIDLGALLEGYHSDLSYTVEVESNAEKMFLDAGQRALEAGIFEFREGNTVGDIGEAMQKVIEAAGYTVSRDLVGHGIGRELHEPPYVPGYGKAGKGAKIADGMVFAIEIIYQKGNYEIAIAEDDWTIVTADGSLGGLFEKTVGVVNGEPVVLAGW